MPTILDAWRINNPTKINDKVSNHVVEKVITNEIKIIIIVITLQP